MVGAEFPHYALRVRYRHERIVEQCLRARGYIPFLPCSKQRRNWSDRRVELASPLFPGYLFCSFDILKRQPIVTLPGVLDVVRAGREPLPVDPQELANIHTLISSGEDVRSCSPIVGQVVRIRSGPLQGIVGVLKEVRSHKRLIVSISILQRAISTSIDDGCVEPL
jgi:transcription antitermination factor NusG